MPSTQNNHNNNEIPTKVSLSKRETWPNLISETGEATPTKIGLCAFHINLCLHELFEPILFFDPHGL